MQQRNHVRLIGNLCDDPELRYASNDTAVANFRLATNEGYTDAQGNRQEHVEYHRVVVWGRLGETLAKHKKKGDFVLVEGVLRTSSWTDDSDTKRYTTEVKAHSIDYLSGSPRRSRSEPQPEAVSA